MRDSNNAIIMKMFNWKNNKQRKIPPVVSGVVAVGVLGSGIGLVAFVDFSPVTYSRDIVKNVQEKIDTAWAEELDKEAYDKKILELVRYTPPAPTVVTEIGEDGVISTTTKVISDLVYSDTHNVVVKDKLWPAKTVYPNTGAILPFQRILAYYGNFYSTRMGILGELEPEEMLAKLQATKEEWEMADPNTPVLPAIHYIAIVAQGSAGADGMYRAVMPDEEIEKAYELTQRINGILILDLQVGKSTLEQELPKFRKYLERPDVHLAVDPEFSMKSGNKPGSVIGTFDATDINYAIDYLSEIVQEEQLPPKVFVVHRFTYKMITNVDQIRPTPEVQVVIHMDGWGPKDLKRGTYNQVVAPEPVQFTGVKIFYKNDLKEPSTGLLTPSETLMLTPKPIYIQYQ